MKKLILDQLIFLLIGIGIIICIPHICTPIFTLIFEFMVIISWGWLCRRIILMPFDILIGKRKKTMFFSRKGDVEQCEFFKSCYFCECEFYYGSNSTLTLLLPLAVTLEELDELNHPKENEKVDVTYYCLSKILVSWDLAD